MDRNGSRRNSGASGISSSSKSPRFDRNRTDRTTQLYFSDAEHNNVLLYIDNSNIFESARKHSARKKGYLSTIIDVACRIDIGKLLTKAIGNRFLLFGKLYGSEPPALDSVWKAIRKKHIEVKTFEKSKWTLKEKETDANLTADAVEDIVLNRDVSGENTVILFSGDRDLLCVVEKAFYHGYRVELWSFKSAINNAVRRAAEENQDKIQINYIDDIFSQVTFTCMVWSLKNYPRERTLMATVSLPKECNREEFFKIFVEKAGEMFKLPMMGKFHDREHIALVPCVKEIYTPPASLSKPKPEGTIDRKYSFYVHIQPFITTLQEHFQEVCSEIIPWNEFVAKQKVSANDNILSINKFQELLKMKDASEDEDQEEDMDSTEIGHRVMLDVDNDFYDLHTEGITDDDDFIPIVPKTKRKGNMYSESCCYKFACTSGTKCDYKHSDEEKEFFKTTSNPKQRFLYKTKACYHKHCKFSKKVYLCPYAHSLEESRCLCCKQQGNGQHWMDECPKITNNTN